MDEDPLHATDEMALDICKGVLANEDDVLTTVLGDGTTTTFDEDTDNIADDRPEVSENVGSFRDEVGIMSVLVVDNDWVGRVLTSRTVLIDAALDILKYDASVAELRVPIDSELVEETIGTRLEV